MSRMSTLHLYFTKYLRNTKSIHKDRESSQEAICRAEKSAIRFHNRLACVPSNSILNEDDGNRPQPQTTHPHQQEGESTCMFSVVTQMNMLIVINHCTYAHLPRQRGWQRCVETSIYSLYQPQSPAWTASPLETRRRCPDEKSENCVI